jgi:hypothetical protein
MAGAVGTVWSVPLGFEWPETVPSVPVGPQHATDPGVDGNALH